MPASPSHSDASRLCGSIKVSERINRRAPADKQIASSRTEAA